MFPVFVGFGSALLFGIFAYGTYGLEGVTDHAWIGMVFSALIAAALLVYAINRKVPCLLCRLSDRVRVLESLCGSVSPCD